MTTVKNLAQRRAERLSKHKSTLPEKDVRELPADIGLTDKQKRDFYLSLAQMSYIEAVKLLGLGERYRTDNSLRAIGYRLMKTIDPKALGISADAVEIVSTAIASRQSKAHEMAMKSEKSMMPDVLDPADTKKLIDGAKNKLVLALHRKLDKLMNSNKAIEDVSLSQLSQAFGTVFDKSQILSGQATENIAVMAKIDKNITPEEALQALSRMREAQEVEKFG